MHNKCFVSHTSEDKMIADILAGALLHLNLHFDFDHGLLQAGKCLEKRLLNSLRQADAVLILLSKNSKGDRFVTVAGREALREPKEKLIFPILLDDRAKDNLVWPLIADRKAIDLSDAIEKGDIRESLQNVVDYVELSLSVHSQFATLNQELNESFNRIFNKSTTDV